MLISHVGALLISGYDAFIAQLSGKLENEKVLKLRGVRSDLFGNGH